MRRTEDVLGCIQYGFLTVVLSLFIQFFSSIHSSFRCGSGKHTDCPGDTSHGILCCELDFVATDGGNQTFN